MIELSCYEHLSKHIIFRDGKPWWSLTGPPMARRTMDRPIGSIDRGGYRRIGAVIDGKNRAVSASRLSFFMSRGWLPKFVDHIDRDRDNNRITNLRPCTRSENGMNRTKATGCSSKYKGVSQRRVGGKWTARAMVRGRATIIGNFIKESDAAMAYNEFATRHFGEFAALNSI